MRLLLPCYSIESLDLDRKEADAEQLLSAWSVLWHPLLLAEARSIPRWVSASSPPDDPASHLVIVPDCCESLLPADWLSRAESAGARVLRGLADRDAMLAAALKLLGEGRPGVDADLAADFLALGFCHFQVEVMTRKLRYMSYLDETSLTTAALAAADEALKGDVEASRRHLQSAFDRLHEAREYFYPTEARLLDLTLLAKTTLGPALQAELARGLPQNFLVSGEVIEEMAAREPETLAMLSQSLADNKAAIVGGEYAELALPMLEPETIAAWLRRGLAAYEKHLGRRPTVFGRRRFGLTPALPQILQKTGFTGALHFTLDDGVFPTGNQSRIQWEGIDGTSIEAIASLPIDAGRADSFLRLAEKLGNAMSLDQSSTVMFAHWPGRSSRWYDDLRRISAYGSVLGTFATVADCFQQTVYTGQRNRYRPDQYRSPYLTQDVAAGRLDPISRWVRYFGRRARLDVLEALAVLSAMCATGGEGRGVRDEGPATRDQRSSEFALAVEDSLAADADTGAALDERLAESLHEQLAGFAQSVVGAADSTQRGCLAINPHSFPQQMYPRPSSLVPRPLLADVPAMGFAWVGPAAEPPPIERKGWFGKRPVQPPPPLAEENVLRNEFFEVRFDPATGAIRSISDYYSRDPRLSQQIALRLPHGGDSGGERNYTIMAADELAVTSSGPLLGEMLSRGRMLDRDGRRVAGFCQTTRAWRGSPVVEIEIELDIERQPDANPWDSYYAARLAWKDETAALFRDANMAVLPTELKRLESPHFIDVCRGKQRTTLLCGGLAYHRRFDSRKLDTLLVVRGERARSFRLGIGIDVPHPISAALGFMSPPLVLPDQLRPANPSGWLFHLDCRNVLATHWAPVLANDDAGAMPTLAVGMLNSPENEPHAHGKRGHGTHPKATGFRVRLLETDGRGVRLGLRCFRSVASASKINPDDVPPTELAVEDDRIDIPIGPHQWIEVEGCFTLP